MASVSNFQSHTIPANPLVEKDQVATGPFSLLMSSVKAGTPILVSLRNNHKLFGKCKAYDRHCNLLMEGVKEIWTETSKGSTVERDRKIGKLFVRGDSVIVILKNPSGAAGVTASTSTATAPGITPSGGKKRSAEEAEASSSATTTAASGETANKKARNE